MKFHPETIFYTILAAKNGDSVSDPFINAPSGSRKTPAKSLSELSTVTPATPGGYKSDQSTEDSFEDALDSPSAASNASSVEHVMTMSTADKRDPEDHGVEVVQLKQPPQSRKPRDTLLRDQFKVTSGAKPGAVFIECIHEGCGYARSWQSGFNATYARKHSLLCEKTPARTKSLLRQSELDLILSFVVSYSIMLIDSTSKFRYRYSDGKEGTQGCWYDCNAWKLFR